MNVEYYNDGYPYIVIDDFYPYDKLDLIWREIDFLMDGDKLDYPDKTSSARDSSGLKKKNKGVFLGDVYSDLKYSNICQCNKKIFKKLPEIMLGSDSWFFSRLGSSPSIINDCQSLLSYYDEGDYYEPHWDLARITMCTWLYKEPKGFYGGDFILNPKETDLSNEMYPTKTIDLKNNRSVIFPGMILHGVTPVKMNTQFANTNFDIGRFTITNFLTTEM